MFQSSLAPTEREHHRAAAPGAHHARFNPLSLHRSESTRVGVRGLGGFPVSILSRSNGARAQPSAWPISAMAVFQSSLAPTEREHRRGGAQHDRADQRFNPLSLLRSESTVIDRRTPS